MATVLSEVVDDHLTRGDIERRVADWQARIADLYARIATWLPDGWTALPRSGRRMHEELMREFGVDAVELPFLDLSGPGRRRASIEPRGLWIVGSNGRLDLTGPSGHFVILDVADNFDPPDWRIAPLSDRRQLPPLDEAALQQAL